MVDNVDQQPMVYDKTKGNQTIRECIALMEYLGDVDKKSTENLIHGLLALHRLTDKTLELTDKRSSLCSSIESIPSICIEINTDVLPLVIGLVQDSIVDDTILHEDTLNGLLYISQKKTDINVSQTQVMSIMKSRHLTRDEKQRVFRNLCDHQRTRVQMLVHILLFQLMEHVNQINTKVEDIDKDVVLFVYLIKTCTFHITIPRIHPTPNTTEDEQCQTFCHKPTLDTNDQQDDLHHTNEDQNEMFTNMFKMTKRLYDTCHTDRRCD